MSVSFWWLFLFFLLERSLFVIGFPRVVVQMGIARTATTNQYSILCACAKLKAEDPDQVLCYYSDTLPKPTLGDKIIVQKTHRCNTAVQASRVKIPVFVTSNAEKPLCNCSPAVVQDYSRYVKEGFSYLSQQIYQEYKPLFDLSDNETAILIDYMKKWEDVRRCCGRQMSRSYISYLASSGISRSNVSASHYCARGNTSKMDVDLKNTYFSQKYGVQSPHTCVIHDFLMRVGLSFDGSNSFQLFGRNYDAIMRMIGSTISHSNATTDDAIFSLLVSTFNRTYCSQPKYSKIKVTLCHQDLTEMRYQVMTRSRPQIRKLLQKKKLAAKKKFKENG